MKLPNAIVSRLKTKNIVIATVVFVAVICIAAYIGSGGSSAYSSDPAVIKRLMGRWSHDDGKTQIYDAYDDLYMYRYVTQGYTTFGETKKFPVEYKSDGDDVLIFMDGDTRRYVRMKFINDNTIERMIEADKKIERRDTYKRYKGSPSAAVIGTWKALGTFTGKSDKYYEQKTTENEYFITITKESIKFDYPTMPGLKINKKCEIRDTNGYDVHIYVDGKHHFTIFKGYTYDHLWLWEAAIPKNPDAFMRIPK